MVEVEYADISEHFVILPFTLNFVYVFESGARPERHLTILMGKC